MMRCTPVGHDKVLAWLTRWLKPAIKTEPEPENLQGKVDGLALQVYAAVVQIYFVAQSLRNATCMRDVPQLTPTK